MSVNSSVRPSGAARLRGALPPVAVLAVAIGYVGVGFEEDLVEPLHGGIPPALYGALVALQAVVIVFRHRFPVPVFCAVVVMDAAMLASSGGELGAGALAVMIATYALVRRSAGRNDYLVVAGGAAVTLVVGTVAAVVVASLSPLLIAVLSAGRLVLQYVIPAALAVFFLGRERLVRALRDRAELAERERLNAVERELAGVRTAMARELHDIAAHHLSGIIVGTQAASALAETDPARAREMLRTVQQDARTTLADLRRTVGLLRSGDTDDDGSAGAPTPVPALSRIPDLVAAAVAHGQPVTFEQTGAPQALGPLAETAGYRMVQESLANAARHASGAPCRVVVDFGPDAVSIVVHNDAASSTPRTTVRGYGISGMEERAELVGARLTVGPLSTGGWRNELRIPYERGGAPS